MGTAELPITSEYLPKWKTWEGLREVIQNALDEEIQNEHEAAVYFDEETSTVTVTNKGSTLDPRAFLFGHTTKAGDARTIGEYGEGLKLGVLALVREGYEVRIDVGSDVWTARFLNSRKYKAKILAFDIEKDVNPNNENVTVTVKGVSASEYFAAIKRFLRFYPAEVIKEGTSSFYGYVLTEAQFRGRIFVKGVWVQDYEGLEFGYDFGNSVELNRDRNLVSDFEISWTAAHVIEEVLKGDCSREFLVRIYNVLEKEESVEAQRLARSLSTESKAKLADLFRERHGEKAVPVRDRNGVEKAEFFGAQPVIVTPHMADTMDGLEGMEASRIAEQTGVEKEYQLLHLSADEEKKLRDACELVSEVVRVKIEDLRIVDFDSISTYGLYFGGEIFVARKVLQRPLWKVIQVVCHEAMHLVGADGTRTHFDSQAIVLCKIISSLWGEKLDEEEKGVLN